MIAEHPERPVWLYRRVGRQYGPVSLVHLMNLAEEGRMDKRLDYIKHVDAATWMPSGEVEGIHRAMEDAPQLDPEVLAREAWKNQLPISVPEVIPASPQRWMFLTRMGVFSLVSGLVFAFWSFFYGEILKELPVYLARAGVVCFIIAHIYLSRWLWHAWNVLRYYGGKIPPALVVALMWVPGVNLLWHCVAFWYWSVEFNVLMSSHPQFRFVNRPSNVKIGLFCLYPILAPAVYYGLVMLLRMLVKDSPEFVYMASLLSMAALFLSFLLYYFLACSTVKAVAYAVDDINDISVRRA